MCSVFWLIQTNRWKIWSLILCWPDYARFYLNHPDAHFLKVKDYPVAELQPVIHVLALSTLDLWSVYIRVYRYRAIYEYKITLNAYDRLLKIVFSFYAIDIPNSEKKW